MELMLKPKRYRRAEYMRIISIITSWDRQTHAYLAVVSFDTTRNRQDSKPLGVKLYGENVETLEKMILDLSLLYAPSNALAVPLPESKDEKRLFSRIVPEEPKKT